MSQAKSRKAVYIIIEAFIYEERIYEGRLRSGGRGMKLLVIPTLFFF